MLDSVISLVEHGAWIDSDYKHVNYQEEECSTLDRCKSNLLGLFEISGFYHLRADERRRLTESFVRVLAYTPSPAFLRMGEKGKTAEQLSSALRLVRDDVRERSMRC